MLAQASKDVIVQGVQGVIVQGVEGRHRGSIVCSVTCHGCDP